MNIVFLLDGLLNKFLAEFYSTWQLWNIPVTLICDTIVYSPTIDVNKIKVYYGIYKLFILFKAWTPFFMVSSQQW